MSLVAQVRAAALFAGLAVALAQPVAAQDPNYAVSDDGENCVQIDCQRHQASNHCGRPVNFAVCHPDDSSGCLLNFFDSLETGESKVFLCKEGKSGKIAACNKPFKPVSVSPFEYRCFPDPNDPDAAQESAKQAESAKAAQSAQEPALQPADPTNCLVVQHDSTIVGTDFGGQPIDIGSSYLANNCNCDMNVAMASMEFAVEANQRTVVPTAGSIVYPYVACFAPQSPAYIGDDKYECRGNKPQSECRITGNFVERRKAEPPAESWNSAAAQSAQPDGSQTSAQPDDSCQYANDGECDEPSPCPTGTDATDCAAESGEEVAEAREADSQLDDSCQHANDGECDEPNICPEGTDATDCASRRSEEAVAAAEARRKQAEAAETTLAGEYATDLADGATSSSEEEEAAEAQRRQTEERRQREEEDRQMEEDQRQMEEAALRRRQAEEDWQRQQAERLRQTEENWQQHQAEGRRQAEEVRQSEERRRQQAEEGRQRQQAEEAKSRLNHLENQQRLRRDEMAGRHRTKRSMLAGISSSTEEIEQARRRQNEEWSALIERQRGELDHFARQYGQDAGAAVERLISAGRAHQQGVGDDFEKIARNAEQRQQANSRILEEAAKKAKVLKENHKDPNRCASLRAAEGHGGLFPYQNLQSTNVCGKAVEVVYRTRDGGYGTIFVEGKSTARKKVQAVTNAKRPFWDGSQKCVEYYIFANNTIEARVLSTAKCPR